MKYARVERERRFLLAAAPASDGSPVRLIEDRYLDGTRLRLRVVREEGQDPAYKLGQKIRPDPMQPSAVAHTPLYLDRSEFDTLRILPGRAVTKVRTLVRWDDLTMAVDVFTGRLQGVVLAEVELGEGGLPSGAPPVPWVADVTDDDRFTGGALAGTDRTTLAELLAGHRLAF